MPVDSDESTKGFAFIEFSTPQEALAAVEQVRPPGCRHKRSSDDHASRVSPQTNGYKLDKSHVFNVTLFTEFDRVMATPKEYVPLPDAAFEEIENLKEWMQDSRARDQFVVRQATNTAVFWNEIPQPELAYERDKWYVHVA
jgi:translation initiation factor 3 subunit B